MTERLRDTVSNTTRTVSSILSRWPAWAAYTASIWSVLYGILGLYWALGDAGFHSDMRTTLQLSCRSSLAYRRRLVHQ